MDNYIEFRDGVMFWMGMNTIELLRFCETPALVYSIKRMRDNYLGLSSTLRTAHPNAIIAVAIKAIGNSRIVTSFKNEDLYCEVMSEEEFTIALRMGFVPQKIIVNGLGWSKEFIQLMCDQQPLLINVDNISDCRKLNEGAVKNGVVLPISLRVVPEGGKSFATLDEKLGTIPKHFDSTFSEISKMQGVRVVSLSAHALHRCDDLEEMKATLGEVIAFVKEKELLSTIKYLDLGGGLETYRNFRKKKISFLELEAAYKDMLSDVPEDVCIILEPGRFIFGDAAIAFGKINTIKNSINKRWLIVDAGTNFLVPIDAACFEAFSINKNEGALNEYYIADGICSPTSVIGEQSFLPANICEGDILAICNAGAYTLALHENWGYSMPSVYLMDENGELQTLIGKKLARRFFVDFWELAEE